MLLLVGGMAVLGYAGYKMSQRDVERVEEHTGQQADELTDEQLEQAMDQLCQSATEAIEGGANLLILSDRGVDRHQAAIPALLATSGLHHYLIRQGLRTRVSLIVESGEPREVHHFATLRGYGADAINPYHETQGKPLSGKSNPMSNRHIKLNKGV